MWRSLVAAFLLAISSIAALAQTATNLGANAGTTSVQVTVANSISPPALVVVGVSGQTFNCSTGQSVSDTQSNSYSLFKSTSLPASAGTVCLYTSTISNSLTATTDKITVAAGAG